MARSCGTIEGIGNFKKEKMTTVLLEKFNSLIEKYGGNDKLADALEKEWLKITVRRNLVPQGRLRDYQQHEIDFIISNYGTHTSEWIAGELKRPLAGIRGKIFNLQQKRILKKAI